MTSATTTDRTRLYGLPGAEVLYFDPADVVEQWLCDRDDDDPVEFTIEEWSVHEPRYHLPTADHLMEWVAEWAAETGEIGEDCDVGEGADEIAAANTFLDAVAATIQWRMADRLLRKLHVTPGDDPDNPLIDGKPAWVRALSGSTDE